VLSKLTELNKLKFVICFIGYLILPISHIHATETLGSDTVRALVFNSNSSIASSVRDLTGSQLIQLIDSLLDQKELPSEMLKQLVEVVGEIALEEEEVPVALSGFYDDSEYPSNSFYGNWDNYKMHPIISSEEEKITLVLQDSINNCTFYPPIKGLITSNYGWRDGRSHHGIDIDLQVWDPVHSAFDGMVRVARHHPTYGRVVVVRHYNGLETLYAHLHRLKVKPGDVVEAGQVVGLGGSSGRSTGSHLHFEVRFRGRPLNPRSIIEFNANRLESDSIVLMANKWGNYTCFPAGINYYTVQKGDFLVKIANRYGTSVQRLCELNGINRKSTLRIGKKLRID